MPVQALSACQNAKLGCAVGLFVLGFEDSLEPRWRESLRSQGHGRMRRGPPGPGPKGRTAEARCLGARQRPQRRQEIRGPSPAPLQCERKDSKATGIRTQGIRNTVFGGGHIGAH